nr:hypothetical protein [candidate division Zixibacteria bacterium]
MSKNNNQSGEIIALAIFMASAYFAAGVVFAPQIIESPSGGLGTTLLKIFFVGIGIICLIAIGVKADKLDKK